MVKRVYVTKLIGYEMIKIDLNISLVVNKVTQCSSEVSKKKSN